MRWSEVDDGVPRCPVCDARIVPSESSCWYCDKCEPGWDELDEV